MPANPSTPEVTRAIAADVWLERAEKHNPILPTPGSPMLHAVAVEMEEYADHRLAAFLREHASATPARGGGELREAVEEAVEGLTSGEGWQLVPVEMTDEMIEAWRNAPGLDCQTAYTAMLAASPKATATASVREGAALAGHVRGIATVIRAFPNDKAWGGVDQAAEAAEILDRAATVLTSTDSGTADTHAGSGEVGA